MADGGDMMCLGCQKSEREHMVEKLLSVAKESMGPKILGRGTYCETLHYHARLPSPLIGDARTIDVSHISF
jgi:hypothetical protein